MKRLILPQLLVGLSLAFAASADEVVPRMPQLPPRGAVRPIPPGTTLQEAYYVSDAGGNCTRTDGSVSDVLPLAYSDTGNSGFYYGGGPASAPPHIVSDGLATAARKDFLFADFTFAYNDTNANPAARWTAVVRIYNNIPPSAAGGGVLVGGPFNVTNLQPGGWIIHVDLNAAAFCAPPNIWFEIDFSDSTVQGGDGGPILTGDPGGAVGISADNFGWDGNIAQGGAAAPGTYFFNGNPHADLYLEVGSPWVPPIGPPATPGISLWNMGAPAQVIFNGAATYLGYSSGNLGAGLDQRWAAVPFRIAAATTISTIDVDWFVVAGSEALNVNYIIWNRTGLAAPVNGNQFASGVLGPYAAGVDDPNIPVVDDWLHRYFVSIPIPAGDYYLTIYGDGGPVPNNAAWLTGAPGADQTLEQGFMWRSSTFPAPGFAVYNPANVQPNGAQDPDDCWNPAFALYRGGIPPCAFDPCDTNCDGSVNQFDIQSFINNLSGTSTPCSPCGSDCNWDGTVNQFDINEFINCLNDPC